MLKQKEHEYQQSLLELSILIVEIYVLFVGYCLGFWN